PSEPGSFRMQSQGWMFVRRIAVAGIALLLAAAVVCAQDAAKSEPKDPDPIVELFSVRSFAVPHRFSIEEDVRVDRRDFKAEDRRHDDGQNGVFSRPIDGLAGPTIGQVDIRDQARNYVKQRLVS